MAISTGKLETILRACERAGMRVLELIFVGFGDRAWCVRDPSKSHVYNWLKRLGPRAEKPSD